MKPGRSGPDQAIRAGRPTRHRVTQKMVDQMAQLRREGLTFKDIGARLACNERTVRRHVGHVRPQIEAPQDKPRPDVDLGRARARLAREFAFLLQDEFELCQSVTLVDEANWRLQRRLARAHPETLQLLTQDQRMRWRFFMEVVGPLCHDLAQSDPTGKVGTGEAPLIWRPPFDHLGTLVWRPPPALEPMDEGEGDNVFGMSADPGQAPQ